MPDSRNVSLKFIFLEVLCNKTSLLEMASHTIYFKFLSVIPVFTLVFPKKDISIFFRNTLQNIEANDA